MLTQKLRQSVQHSNDEKLPRNEKINRKVGLLHHCVVISNWIQQFNPDTINDVFDNIMMPLSDKVRMVQNHSINDIKKIDKMSLSPSRAHLNTILRGNSRVMLHNQTNQDKDIFS